MVEVSQAQHGLPRIGLRGHCTSHAPQAFSRLHDDVPGGTHLGNRRGAGISGGSGAYDGAKNDRDRDGKGDDRPAPSCQPEAG